MSLEERIRDSLQDQADQIQVDLPRVRELTEAKLAAPRHRRSWPLLAAAAAVAVVAAGAALLARPGGPAPTHPPAVTGPHGPYASHGPQSGGVDTRFSCPTRSTVRFDPVAKNLSFVPSLEHGPRWFAGQMAAPRYAFQAAGDTATLRLGNADGSLASVSTFTRTSTGQWQVQRATKCVGDLTPTGIVARLGVHEAKPYPPSTADEFPRCSTPVFIDDRGYYDAAGLRRHTSLYAVECPGGAVQLVAVRAVAADGMAMSSLAVHVPDRSSPMDVSRVLAPDASPGRSPLGLWALNDPRRRVANVSVTLRDGTVRPADQVIAPSWSGPVFLVLAPRDEVSRLVVRPRQGAATTYSTTNPPGYRR